MYNIKEVPENSPIKNSRDHIATILSAMSIWPEDANISEKLQDWYFTCFPHFDGCNPFIQSLIENQKQTVSCH